jgi:predicted DNA-binding WGR domain protein
MRIYMQIPPEGDKAPRYYHLHLQEDLLQGTRGRLKRENFADRETAEEALLRARDDQLKRGYRVVFMQAQTG